MENLEYEKRESLGDFRNFRKGKPLIIALKRSEYLLWRAFSQPFHAQ